MGQECGAPVLAQYTGYLLRRVQALSVDHARDCISDDLHVRGFVILSILADRGAVSQRQLGDLMHVNRSVMVKLVDDLEREHHVVRERNPADRRSYALRLTEAGEGARVEAQRDLDRSEAILTAPLTQAQTGRLKQLLHTLLVDEPEEISSLSERLGYLLARAHRVWRTRAEAAMESLGLLPRDFGALMTIARHQPCSQNELAASLGVSPPTALSFVDALEERGLVARARNRTDRRVHDLTLTDHGAAHLTRAIGVADDVQGEVTARLGPAADAELRALLAKLLDAEK